ncbi:MAG: NAD-dependent epimerase/dehydratase family protein [Oligoflexia bacterium]|nr:NAD-dependent epimerase/dehydratase family protein [Oligoflexia bacterium]
MGAYNAIEKELRAGARRWVVTGAAGFIGSHLCERLLSLGQRVVGIDNFSTGQRRNIQFLTGLSTAAANFSFIEADICDYEKYGQALGGADYLLHQAALGSVSRSIDKPLDTNRANVDGFLCVIEAARKSKIQRCVFASSSSVYGDAPELPKIEARIGNALSPYAVSKRINELYAEVYGRVYGTQLIGLRYFNVFGPRQDPSGAYAAVIPRWIAALAQDQECTIYGDGETSRDFCFVENVIQANILAATTTHADAIGKHYNIACHGRTTLRQLHAEIGRAFSKLRPNFKLREVRFGDFRAGDVRHSLASIELAQRNLGYAVAVDFAAGIEQTVNWYLQNPSKA